MEEATPAKRRKTETINDVPTESKIKQWTTSGNVEINAVPVKPDKLQKLRRIAAKMLPPATDDVIISSTGSSPTTSPRPENLSALSEPVDPAELFARLTVLVEDDNKENWTLKTGEENLQAGDEESKKINDSEDDVKFEPMTEKILNIPMSAEQFYAVLRKMINEKVKQLEDNFNETIIPNLQKKITTLESENNYLHEHAKKLQEMLTNLAIEYKKQQKQKSSQVHAGVQVGSSEPPPLTPMGSAIQTVSLPNKTAPVIHVVDNASEVYKPPSTVPPHGIQVTTIASPYSLRGAALVNGIRHTATASTGHVFTSSAGQPRMYSEAPYKPGTHPNAVVTARSQASFPRTAGPITATVYPQPQNLPTSPSTLGVRRGSTPTQLPPNRFPYNPQAANGVMMRTPAQATLQYVVNPEKSTGQTLAARQKSPSYQGPPPSYSVANARPPQQQQQVTYRPGTTTNPAQVNGVRHYAVRPSPPAGGMVGTPVRSPAGPPPLVRAQPNMRPQLNNPPRYQTSHVIRQRPPYQQNPPGNEARSQATTVPPRNPNVPPLPPHSSPSQTNGVLRDPRPPPTPTVSISGASNGIVLSWNMVIPEGSTPIDSYQLFAYQNSREMANTPSLWKKLGIVKALPLPMACTLTQFVSGSMYYFAVRAIDIHGRAGDYSAPCAITLPSENEK